MIAAWSPPQARLALGLFVGKYEHASRGTRRALASFLDAVAMEAARIGHAELSSYAAGRAEGLRRVSRSRYVRPQMVN